MNCGSRLSESDRFCAKCGSPVSRQNDQQDHSIQEQSGAIVYGVHKYEGTAKRLPFVGGLTIDVSAAKDATNEYQRQFKNYVNERMRSFQQEYRLKCRTFDGYMDNFVEINADYVREMEDVAVGLLFSYGHYHYTVQDILNYLQETPAFKKVEEFHENNMELGRAYLQDNYDQAVSRANRMPAQTFFGTGLGGMAMSYGLSAATGAIQNKRANKLIANSQKLTKAQEKEFFSIVREADVMYIVWDELINVGNTALNILAQLDDELVAWPYQHQIDEAFRIFENMQNPRFPQDQFVAAAKFVLEEFPYISQLYPLLRQKLGNMPQIDQIEQYFYDPDVNLFFRVFPEYRS